MHLKFTHMPIGKIDFTEIANTLDRSPKLGTVIEQQDRIARVFFLIKEVPTPPRVKGST